MTTLCYVRVANKACLSDESHAELAKACAEKRGFKVVNTGSSQLDARLLSLLTSQQAQLNGAVITFRG